MPATFEPKMLAFLCNWCSYAGADLAGVSRFQYPPTIRVLRTMCSGRVDPLHLVEALGSGFDAVLVFGCHIGDCHYLEGNYYTQKRIEIVRQLMDLSQIGSERVQLKWVSAAEGQLFADGVKELSRTMAELGPFDREKNASALSIVGSVLSTPRVRWLLGMDRQLTQRENVFHEKISEEQYAEMLSGVVKIEYQKALILESLKDGPLSVREIAAATGLPIYTVSQRLGDLEKTGMADLHGYQDSTPRFFRVAV